MAKRLSQRYRDACRLAERGDYREAQQAYGQLAGTTRSRELKALVANDLGTLAFLTGDWDSARNYFERALTTDAECGVAQSNLAFLGVEEADGIARRARPLTDRLPPPVSEPRQSSPRRVAVLSFLFNWPSTGGGIIHTVELCKFLSEAGYEVRLLHARYEPWGIGRNDGTCPFPATAIRFDESTWHLEQIKRAFHEAVDDFQPDAVLITDSWNIKPHLADAVRGYRYFLRLQALECLCPLNNLRLLPSKQGLRQCPNFQFADAARCRRCVEARGEWSGQLHQAERAMSGFGTEAYFDLVSRTFWEAAGVLALNQSVAELVRPYASDVRVVTWGMDPERFPANAALAIPERHDSAKTVLLFAGLVEEQIKGFDVLHAACEQLWQVRQDFELVATGEPAGRVDEFTRFVGWHSQAALPDLYRSVDVTIVPTIAQDGLSRTAVESMGAGRAVIGSRIGGLPDSIEEGITGLLFEPGNADDLAQRIAYLIDRPELRQRMGEAGRKRFERDYLWPTVIEREYVPLLGAPRTSAPNVPAGSSQQGIGSENVGTPPIAEQSWPVVTSETTRLGCVMAVRNRPVQFLERTLPTYGYQTCRPTDKLLLDFGSDPEMAEAYRRLCRRYGWRFFRTEPAPDEWSLTSAYNLAVSCLDPRVNVVFKGDADVLLGPSVLEAAARLGRDRLCIFSCQSTGEFADYPDSFDHPRAFQRLLDSEPRLVPLDGEGIHAYPRAWFEVIGGFDLAYKVWGFEDSDLRERADWSIGYVQATGTDLIHQWHPWNPDFELSRPNWEYYQSQKPQRRVVRNDGRLMPQGLKAERVDLHRPIEQGAGSIHPAPWPVRSMAIATRSLDDDLFRLSDEFLKGTAANPSPLSTYRRFRFMGTRPGGYLRELAKLQTDWVINLDEDCFVIDAQGILDLVALMEREGYAACGMPDGGVVPIRRHNPAACNAYFNIFDLRRARPVWTDWTRVEDARHRGEYQQGLPAFVSRGSFEFDEFEPYYGAFFALLDAGERILYLDAEEWEDGISTVLKHPDGRPLVIHCWYARLWRTDEPTRHRFERAAQYARDLTRRQVSDAGASRLRSGEQAFVLSDSQPSTLEEVRR